MDEKQNLPLCHYSNTMLFDDGAHPEANPRPECESCQDIRPPLDDTQFAVVVLAVASFTLIIFVLAITLLMP